MKTQTSEVPNALFDFSLTIYKVLWLQQTLSLERKINGTDEEILFGIDINSYTTNLRRNK